LLHDAFSFHLCHFPQADQEGMVLSKDENIPKFERISYACLTRSPYAFARKHKHANYGSVIRTFWQ
jgi:hypothetical protein